MKKNILFSLLFVLFTLHLSPFSLQAQWDGTSAPWTQGNGTQSNPYLIETPNHLAYLAEMVSGGVNNYQNKYFLLTNDISLSNQPWLPIGDASALIFRGNFDGGGHTIDSMYITGTLTDAGLFGRASGTIENITLYGTIDANGQYTYCGAFVARAEPGTTLKKLHSYCNIGGGAGIVGGIVGINTLSATDTTHYITIEDCSNHGNISNGGTFHQPITVGGIIGWVTKADIMRCANYGNVTIDAASQAAAGYNYYAGGICGRIQAGVSTYSNVLYCYNRGAVGIYNGYFLESWSNYTWYLTHGYSSGIVGGCELPTVIKYCYNRGSVSTYFNSQTYSYNTYRYAFGIAHTDYANLISNCYSTGYLTANTDGQQFTYGISDQTCSNSYYSFTCNATNTAYGSSRTEAQMKSVSFPTVMNVGASGEAPFVMDELGMNDGFPVLQWDALYNVQTNAMNNVTCTTIKIYGSYSGLADSCGFVYCAEGSTDSITVITPQPTSQGNYEAEITSLTPGTTYKYRFFARRDVHTAYGEERSIQTHSLKSVTATSTDNNKGSVLTSGTVFCPGEIDTLVATPAAHYQFSHWSTESQSVYSTANPLYLTVAENLALQAHFEDEQLTITLASNNAAWGSTAVSVSGPYSYGQAVLISATANQGYHFEQWSDGNSDNPRIINIENSISLTATFAPNQYTVTLLVNDSLKGTVSGGGVYTYGQQTYIIASPIGNYTFQQWSDGNTDAYRLITVTQDISYTAIFTDAVYTLTVQSINTDYGTVTGTGSYVSGTDVQMLATPNTGYHFSQWQDGNQENPRTVTVTANTTYTAQFAANSYTVTATSANQSMGSVIGGGSYNYSTTATIEATPQPHYHFTGWNDGSTANPRTFTVSGDTSFTATFALDQHTVNVNTQDASRGTVSGGGTFDYGSQTTIQAIAAQHYHFAQWSDGDTNNPRTITVSGDITYTSQFVTNSYTINVTAEDATTGNALGSGSYSYGSQAIIEAVAASHYHFVQWSDGSVTNPRTVIVSGDAEYVAQFAIDQHNITVTSADVTMGSATGSGSYNYGTQTVISATPATHYHFTQWNDGVTDNPRTVTVTANATYTAQFGADSCTVTVTAQDPTQGIASGGGTFFYGTQITIIATPLPHNSFQQWSDGNTQNPRTIIVGSDTTFTAIFFHEQQYTVTVVSDNPEHGTASGGGTYYAGETTTIMATPLSGHLFSHWSDGNTEPLRTVVVTGNVTYTAYFSAVTYTVNVFSNDDNLGTVSGGGSYEGGATATVTATPAAGCRFVRWSNGVETNPYTFTVYGDVNLIATFERNTGIAEAESGKWKVLSVGRTVTITGAEGQSVAIYDALGRKVAQSTSHLSPLTFHLPAAGVYMIRSIDNSITLKTIVL